MTFPLPQTGRNSIFESNARLSHSRQVERVDEEDAEFIPQCFGAPADVIAAIVDDDLKAVIERQAEMAARNFDDAFPVFDDP